MIAGLLMAVGCALAGSVGMLLKHRGAVAAPNVLARHPLRRLFAGKAFGKSIAAASRSCGDRPVPECLEGSTDARDGGVRQPVWKCIRTSVPPWLVGDVMST